MLSLIDITNSTSVTVKGVIHVTKVIGPTGEGFHLRFLGCDEVKEKCEERPYLGLSLVANTRPYARSSLGGDHSQAPGGDFRVTKYFSILVKNVSSRFILRVMDEYCPRSRTCLIGPGGSSLTIPTTCMQP